METASQGILENLSITSCHHDIMHIRVSACLYLQVCHTATLPPGRRACATLLPWQQGQRVPLHCQCCVSLRALHLVLLCCLPPPPLVLL